MELWIRSQNKNHLIKSKELYLSDQIKYKTVTKRIKKRDFYGNYYDDYEEVKEIDKYIRCEMFCNRTFVGAYKTKRRALEVLDEIQGCLKPNFDAILTKDGLEVKPLNNSIYVYQMPKC